MKKMLIAAAATAALVGCNNEATADSDLPVADAPIEEVEAPEGQQWQDVVEKTAAGGYLMGNPDAPVKLVEFGSLTCGACAQFDAQGTEPLNDYVNSGRVSFEFRNYVREPVDMTAALLSRCGTDETFFPFTHALFANQGSWFGENIPQIQAVMQEIQGQEPTEQFPAIAEATGLKTFAVQRGVPATRAEECLASEEMAGELVAIRDTAIADYQINATPTFLLNNRIITEANQWPGLQPILARALGEEAAE